MSRTSLIGARVVLAIIVVSSAIACEPQRTERFYHETFEGPCDGGPPPCGWERSMGPGEATWVETLLPGEHGLRLTGDVTVRGPGGTRTSASDLLSMRLSVRCDDSSNALSAVVVLSDATGTYTLPVPSPGVLVWSGELVTDWQERTLDLIGMGTFNTSIVAVVLMKTGAGSCEIGDILIDDLRFAAD